MRKQFPNLLKKALFAFLLCSGQAAFAQSAPEFIGDHCYSSTSETPPFDCCHSPCHNRLVLCAELLYLKPTVEQSSYVINSFENFVGDEFFPNGPRIINKAPYKPGFRVGGMVDDCCGDKAFGFRFTYFDAGYHESTTGLFLFDTIGYVGEGAPAPEDTSYAGTATVHDSFRYYAFDITLNRFSCGLCSEDLAFLVGLHYANIRYNRIGTSVGTFNEGDVNNSFYSHSNFWGIGPEVGVDYRYHLDCLNSCRGKFALTASGRGALLASSTTARINYTSLRTAGTGGIALDNEQLWRVTPTLDATLGGSFQFRLFCLDMCLDVGYEWIWYNDAIDDIVGNDVAFPGNSIDVYNNLSMQGPYVRLCFGF